MTIPKPVEAVTLAEPFDQRAWDYEAMTLIAAHLRENPAHPYSGRQCEEFVLDARERLYGPPDTKTVGREELQARVDELEGELDALLAYCRWTISDESPGHHPTMPSAVARATETLGDYRGKWAARNGFTKGFLSPTGGKR